MKLIENKKVGLKYEFLHEYSAGLELLGLEAKSLRQKNGSLEGSRVLVRGGEAYLVGATIPPAQIQNAPETYDPTRVRRLLLSKREIFDLDDAEAKKGLTIVPIEVYTKGRLMKLRLAIARGKFKADKREAIKKREAEIDIGRALRKR